MLICMYLWAHLVDLDLSDSKTSNRIMKIIGEWCYFWNFLLLAKAVMAVIYIVFINSIYVGKYFN